MLAVTVVQLAAMQARMEAMREARESGIKVRRLTKERFIAGGAAAVPVAGGVVLGIRFRFHNHAPQQLA